MIVEAVLCLSITGMEPLIGLTTRRPMMLLTDTSELIGRLPSAQRAHRRPSATASSSPQTGDIGRQAQEIINDILSPGSACEETIRQGLRRHIAAHPGRPDLALLEHVLAVRGHAIAGRTINDGFIPSIDEQRENMFLTATDPGPEVSSKGREEGAMLASYVHQAILVMGPEADLDAPGAAITLKLCGSWDHSPPCRVPHHVHAEGTGATVSLRVLFVAEPENEQDVRRRIDQALSAGRVTDRAGASTHWQFGSSAAAELSPFETARARRLAGT